MFVMKIVLFLFCHLGTRKAQRTAKNIQQMALYRIFPGIAAYFV
jgi:hypothetical protein